jgi:hypothetical protein
MYVKYTRVKSKKKMVTFILVYNGFYPSILYIHLYSIFNVKGGGPQPIFLVSVYVHIVVSWPDDDPSLGSKLAAI